MVPLECCHVTFTRVLNLSISSTSRLSVICDVFFFCWRSKWDSWLMFGIRLSGVTLPRYLESILLLRDFIVLLAPLFLGVLFIYDPSPHLLFGHMGLLVYAEMKTWRPPPTHPAEIGDISFTDWHQNWED
jgi:hypothetical protein